MGIFRDAITGVIKDVAKDTGLEASYSAAEFVSRKVSGIKDNRNISKLKKEAKNNEYCLFVEKEGKIGEGIYTITTKKKEKKYNTLMDHLENGAFILHLFHHLKGEVGSLQKTVMMKQGLFSSKPIAVNYVLHNEDQVLGEVYQTKEGDQEVFLTSFNDWVAIGNFEKGKYKIFSKSTGKTLATVSRRYASASTYLIECEHDKNEPIIISMSLLFDMLIRR